MAQGSKVGGFVVVVVVANPSSSFLISPVFVLSLTRKLQILDPTCYHFHPFPFYTWRLRVSRIGPGENINYVIPAFRVQVPRVFRDGVEVAG